MPEYLAPGVYIEEIGRGPRPIEGVPTSTAAFLGETERGQIEPRLLTSYEEFQRWFGGVFGDDTLLHCAASGFFENGGKRLYVCRVVGKAATPAEAVFGDFTVRAVGPGSWGRRVWARIDNSSRQALDAGGKPQPVGIRLRLAYWATVPADFQPFDPFDPANADRVPRPLLTEDFDDLKVDATSPDVIEKHLRHGSTLAMLVRNPGAPPGAKPASGSQALAQNGTDDPGPLGAADYEGNVAGNRTQVQGLAALETDPYRDVALVYAPAVAVDVARRIIRHCERMRFRFAVIDAERGLTTPSALDPRSNVEDTPQAAFYYPWIQISDRQTGARRLVPPGGHVLGIYARVDSERGVFKAPANEIVRGVLQLEADITDKAQDGLNPRGVNAIRSFRDRGIRVWGARTLSSNALWKYISVRRLLIFLERSIYEGTQWVVFEPNDSRLWARLTNTIREFLYRQWQDGALVGSTEEEAFFVACDQTTMTQDDILSGRLICEIGIASVRPAEFVVFRIIQNTAEAEC